MEISTKPLLTLTAFIALLSALLLRLFRAPDAGVDFNTHHALASVLRGLLRFESLAEERRGRRAAPLRVAVGFGGCRDVFARAVPLLDRFGAAPPSPDRRSVHHASIGDETQLSEGVAYFFRHGAAAERYVSQKELFARLVAAADAFPATRHELGGNAPVMANRMATEGAEVLLAARLSRGLVEALHPMVRLTEGSGEGVDDDVHLILEYSKGEQWGEMEAPRANRYIMHSDADNPWVTSLEPLQKSLTTFEPDLVVIGGLQTLDGFPGFHGDQRSERLAQVGQFLSSLPSETLTHFELASFSDESLFQEIVDSVVRRVDSLGMNEQELPNLQSILTLGEITTVSEAYPRVANVLDRMRKVFALLRRPRGDRVGDRPLSRLHVHTLAYQAIMTAKGSAWRDSPAAAAKASLVANRHICGSLEVDAKKAKILMDEGFSASGAEGSARIPFDPEDPVSCWEEEEEEGDVVEICVAPVLVCLDVKQTAGGGDNVSSAGLMFNV